MIRILRISDIDHCPVKSLLPSHYNDDGTCQCPEPLGHHRALAQEKLEEEDK